MQNYQRRKTFPFSQNFYLKKKAKTFLLLWMENGMEQSYAHIYLNAHLHVYSIPREIHRHSTNITACSIKAPQRTGAQSKHQQIYQGHTDVRVKNEGFHKVIISS